MELIDKYYNKDWNWVVISENPTITLKFIEKYIYKSFNWGYISKNQMMTIDYFNVPLNKDLISYNEKVIMDTFNPNKDYTKYEWVIISRNIFRIYDKMLLVNKLNLPKDIKLYIQFNINGSLESPPDVSFI